MTKTTNTKTNTKTKAKTTAKKLAKVTAKPAVHTPKQPKQPAKRSAKAVHHKAAARVPKQPVAGAPIVPVQVARNMARLHDESVQLGKKAGSWLDTEIRRFHRPIISKIFVIASLLTLLATVVYWTVLSVQLHQANADQLVDSYLFETPHTFREAIFPGTHTFLLKWPIFALMQLLGSGLTAFMVATLLVVLFTVGLLVLVLRRIEPRPAMFGLLVLALASILLLVPTQPYPGALLPVNMAMLTTRNLEYAVFISALYLAARLKRVRSWHLLPVLLLLLLVIASDKLFAVLAAGSGLFICGWYYLLWRRPRHALAAGKWLALTIVAAAVAAALLALITKLKLTGIANVEAASPFAIALSPKQLVQAALYGLLALLTNFGANPLHSIISLQGLPAGLLAALKQSNSIAYAINGLLMLAGLVAIIGLLRQQTARRSKHKTPVADHWTHVSIMLTGASLAALVVFVMTDHYYPVDARYLTICMFTVMIAAAAYWRHKVIRSDVKLLCVVLVALSIVVAIPRTYAEYSASQTAMSSRAAVTARASHELQQHHIQRLVGNYWDVVPVKGASKTALTAAAVQQCSAPRDVLNSHAWFEQSKATPFAFLAVRDGSPVAGPDSLHSPAAGLTTYGGCSLARLASTYGVPSERIPLTTGSTDRGQADTYLLLYPNGIKPLSPTKPVIKTVKPIEQPAAAVPVPVTPALVSLTDRKMCPAGTTLQIVAHEDDDILFMNPDLFGSIASGSCLRTVYVTSGNAGEGPVYWNGREQGAKAAYAAMYGVANVWQDQRQSINGQPVTVSYLQDIPDIALTFLRLPDGNLRGEGFAGNRYQSLHHLLSGQNAEIKAVDDSASYSKQSLIDCLQTIMTVDQTEAIRTQGGPNVADGDHADHHDVGILADQASAAYQPAHSIVHYIGYPERELPINISQADIDRKFTIFLTYAKYDGAVCQTTGECQETLTYGSYLTRQYPVSAAQ